MGMMLALLEVSKRALDGVLNVELITFLFIIYTLFMGKKVIYIALAFTVIETFYWGINYWCIMYLYIWPVLILVTDAVKKHSNVWLYSILSGIYGLTFGLMCSVVYLFIGGPIMMFTWWVAGIPYDIIHGVSNFIICLVLFKPASYALKQLQKNYGYFDN